MVFDDIYFDDLAGVYLVLCLPRFTVLLCFLPALILIFLVLTQELAGKCISDTGCDNKQQFIRKKVNISVITANFVTKFAAFTKGI